MLVNSSTKRLIVHGTAILETYTGRYDLQKSLSLFSDRYISSLVYNPVANVLFVTTNASDNVYIVSVDTLEIIGSFSSGTGKAWLRLEIDTDLNVLICTSTNASNAAITVTTLSLTDYSFVSSTTISPMSNIAGAQAVACCYNDTDKLLYISYFTGDNSGNYPHGICSFSMTTKTMVTKTPMLIYGNYGYSCNSLAYNPITKNVYFCNTMGVLAAYPGRLMVFDKNLTLLNANLPIVLPYAGGIDNYNSIAFEPVTSCIVGYNGTYRNNGYASISFNTKTNLPVSKTVLPYLSYSGTAKYGTGNIRFVNNNGRFCFAGSDGFLLIYKIR